MKKLTKLLALVLALTLCAGTMLAPAYAEETATANEPVVTEEAAAAEESAEEPAVAEEAAAAEETAETPAIAPETVMATVAGEEITMAQVDEMSEQLISYYYNNYGYDLSGEEMRDTVIAVSLGTIIQNKVIEKKGEELGLNTLTDEEIAAITAEVEASWEEAVTYYMEGYFGVTETSTDEEKADARVNALAMLESMGYSLDALVQDELDYAKYTKVEAVMTADAAVADEDVQAAFDQQVAADEEAYKNDVGAYEYNEYYGGASLYMPEGYRGVLQILLAVDDTLLDAYTGLADKLGAEPAEGEEAVTQEQVDAALAEVMASIQPTYDEIVEKYNGGAAITDLIAEYNTDPGMTNEENLANGYAVHKDSIVFDPQFVAAAFSIDEIGQLSQPYVGSYGAYVVYYLRDIPGGAAEMTDEIKAALTEELLADKRQEAYTATLDTWMTEYEVKYTEVGQPYAMIDAE